MGELGSNPKKTMVWVLLMCSILLNLFLAVTVNHYYNKELSWSVKAAKEAEAVAAISCSGHGRAFLDGVEVDTNDDESGHRQACECNACYAGPDCSLFVPQGCQAEANGGDPYFLEPFWMQHATSSALLVPGWHRMSYVYGNDKSYTSTLLETRIRKLHSIVGNAVTAGRYIVFGAGSTQLLNAAVHALSPHNSSLPPARLFASIPYYARANPVGGASITKGTEAILIKGPRLEPVTETTRGIPAPADKDVMIFSISKVTGHAGSRFGWAVIKDKSVYERMYDYTSKNMMGVSRDTQTRALKLLDVVLKSGGRELFEFGYETMKRRWEKLSKTLSASKRFSLRPIPPENCTFFNQLRDPTPAYAWLRCEREEDTNCYRVLKSAGINGREGIVFGGDARYVRLSIIRSQDDFDLLLQRLTDLVSGQPAMSM